VFRLGQLLNSDLPYFRHEGTLLFYERNRLIHQIATSRTMNSIQDRLGSYKDLVRYIILEFGTEGTCYVDRIWNLLMTQQELGAIVTEILRNFNQLYMISIRFNLM
jgi:hypothetical protein